MHLTLNIYKSKGKWELRSQFAQHISERLGRKHPNQSKGIHNRHMSVSFIYSSVLTGHSLICPSTITSSSSWREVQSHTQPPPLQRCVWLAFGRWSVRMSAETTSILAEIFRGFPQSLQANYLGHGRFLPHTRTVQFIIHNLPVLRRYVVFVISVSSN
jgi:hypothetical protein